MRAAERTDLPLGGSGGTSDFLVRLFAELEARLARLEARVAGEPEDDALGIAAAARFIGYSPSNLRKLVRRDPALAACYWRAPGRSSRLIFSLRRLEAWKAARS